MRVAICEDEPLQAESLQKLIDRWSREKDIPTIVDHFPSSESFLHARIGTNSIPFDLLFLDIKMEAIDGMQLAETIRKSDQRLPIVFVTSVKSQVFRSFDVGAMKYILKPIKEKDCFSILDKAYKIMSSWKNDVFLVPQANRTIRLLCNEILYFNADGHYITVHSTIDNYDYKGRISDLEDRLPATRFFQCHRKYFVNFYHVRMVSREGLRMDNNDILPVSNSRWEPLNTAFAAYHTNEHL